MKNSLTGTLIGIIFLGVILPILIYYSEKSIIIAIFTIYLIVIILTYHTKKSLLRFFIRKIPFKEIFV